MSKEFKRVLASIPMPQEDVHSLHVAVMATKDLVEALAGQRGTVGDTAVTFNDLVRLGLIDRTQVPKQLG